GGASSPGGGEGAGGGWGRGGGGGAGAAPSLPYRIAVLQGLDKVTARTTIIEAPVGQEVMFGRLGITPRTCLKTPPTEPPESAAFLEIRSLEPGEPPRTDFVGWMMASSPALSALEHPVYDVWVIDCEEPAGPTADPTTPKP
ncbi:MAG TPA: DUF2155 domain-containing protein, partial [Geminicoccaceae bacterium]|nr:DUF2155 domain-containing protein [Geminicoccaceae bacterium]